MKVDFKSLDAWFEEQSEVLFHPKDPFHRVDILPSGRHVKVEIDGVMLADTAGEGGVMSLWETNFPGRWYLPRTAVSEILFFGMWDLLAPAWSSGRIVMCPVGIFANDEILGQLVPSQPFRDEDGMSL